MAHDDGPGTQQVERKTTTRDLAETRVQLEGWFAERLPPGSAPAVSDLEAPGANGLSSETLLFEVSWSEDGAERTQEFAARVAPDPANKPVFPVYDLQGQFRVLQLLAPSAVPVPRVWWLEQGPDVLGASFFVMERVHGRVPPDLMPYNFGSWLSEADPADQRRMQDESVRVLAAIHSLDSPAERFSFLAPDGGGLRRHVEGQRRYYEWVAEGTPSPLIERCFAWLEDNWPETEGPTVLSWGDARIGNMMFREFDPVAVFDWEMASLGPAEIDLAWFIFLHRFFEDIAAALELPGMPHFLRRDDVVATYEAATGRQVRDLDFFLFYAALRHGIVMSRTQRRAIHFGEAEMPDDIDDLIMHRATLEQMLAGTYWDGVR